MKDWLKFFTGSFFLDKYALEGAGRRLVNAVLGLFLSFLFIYTGLTVGYRSSFKTHYNNCNDFKNAIYSVFANENENLRIEISTNKMIPVPLPGANDREEFVSFLCMVRKYNPSSDININANKCRHCIYCNLCDKNRIENVYI